MTLFTMLTPELCRTLATYELIMLSEAKPAGRLLLALQNWGQGLRVSSRRVMKATSARVLAQKILSQILSAKKL